MKRKWILLMAVCLPMVMQAKNDTIIRHFTDTIMSVQQLPDSTLKQREVVIPADSSDRRGHYIEAHLGLGYGSLGYSLNGAANSTHGSFSALMQLQYAYFFHPNWGVGAGVWFTDYTTVARIGGTYRWPDQTDTDMEQHYDHVANVNRWREYETVHNLGIPVSLQFQYEKEDWRARLFGAVGIAPAFSLMKSYRVRDGEIAHSGYYPAWDLTLTDMHEFGTKDYRNAPCARGPLSLRTQVYVFMDLGALLPITKQVDLFLGGYFNVCANDANSSTKHALGWKDADFTFMEEYTGAYATDLAGASHPWEAGIKIGIHWHYIAPDKHEMEDYFDYFLRPDTSYAYVPRADTIIEVIPDPIPEPVKKVAREVEKFNKIYFAFDSYRLTNRSQNYLSSIVAALNRVPEAKIAIDGHASSEGQSEYNDILSERRAKAVADYLVLHGVDKERVIIVGHGSRQPNEDMEHEQLRRDRRVEVKVLYNDQEVEH